jgi:hypothetical protein
MSRDYAERVLSELGRTPTNGLMRGELAILVLDVDDDAVTDPMKCAERRRAGRHPAPTPRGCDTRGGAAAQGCLGEA